MPGLHIEFAVIYELHYVGQRVINNRKLYGRHVNIIENFGSCVARFSACFVRGVGYYMVGDCVLL